MNRNLAASRHMFLAGVSALAIVASSSQLQAADLPLYTKAPPAPPAWLWWVEGGAFWTGGGSILAGDPVNLGLPPVGGEGAVGYKYHFAASPWSVSGQFRYGATGSGGPKNVSFSGGGISTSGTLQINNEHHWLVDFNVGRDLGVGNNTEATFGVRVADLYSKASGLNIAGNTTTKVGPPVCSPVSCIVNTPFSGPYSQTGEFLGAGPRVGLDGSVPLGGHWTFDWLGGAAVLFGTSKLNTIGIAQSTHFPTLSISNSPSVFNLDGQLGLSYWFNPRMSVMASFRVDSYFNALKTFNAAGGTSNVDRDYYGPMLRLTIRN